MEECHRPVWMVLPVQFWPYHFYRYFKIILIIKFLIRLQTYNTHVYGAKLIALLAYNYTNPSLKDGFTHTLKSCNGYCSVSKSRPHSNSSMAPDMRTNFLYILIKHQGRFIRKCYDAQIMSVQRIRGKRSFNVQLAMTSGSGSSDNTVVYLLLTIILAKLKHLVMMTFVLLLG